MIEELYTVLMSLDRREHVDIQKFSDGGLVTFWSFGKQKIFRVSSFNGGLPELKRKYKQWRRGGDDD